MGPAKPRSIIGKPGISSILYIRYTLHTCMLHAFKTRFLLRWGGKTLETNREKHEETLPEDL